MSNSVKIEALLTAVDQAMRPFKTFQAANVSLSDQVKETQTTLRGLYSQVAQIDGFTRTQSALTAVSQQLKVAKESTQALASELKKIDQPTQTQISALEKARRHVSALSQQHDGLRQSVKNQRQALRQAGISTRAPASARQRLQNSINDNTGQLNTQRDALAQENRQNRMAKIKAGQNSILGIAGNISAAGKTGMSVATTGVNLGKKLLQPGYEASLKNPPAASPGTAVAGAPNGGNLGTDLEALQAAYQSLSVDIFSTQESSLRQLVQTATRYIGQLQQWVRNNQGLVQTFGMIATVVIGVAGALGTVASVLAPVFTGISTLITLATSLGSVFTTVCGGIVAVLGSLTWPIVGIIAFVAAVAVAIYACWEPISAFFSGVVEGIKAGFAPLAELFVPFQPVFDAIGSTLSSVKNLFSDLIAPIAFSQQALERCGNVGKGFGQVLFDALSLPFKPLKLLMEGVGWLLEKLDIVNKQPAIVIPKPQVDATAAGGTFGYIQPTSTMPGFNNYQAAKPAGSHSYVDQSKTEYNVTLQGDITPGSSNERYLQDMFRQDAENKRNAMLSQYNSSGGF
ncbi:phage tail tape measure protein [Kosakonia sp.]|uniref:phage tail tape measure protein n=1 Tax=Kosakonia sp. TaxID=1916651 RepID=UPI0028999CE0|nr:phage tail tape measure protein [Kosakonia sp.]